jgi:predicted nuclease of predicted toxin-antitoxin system
MALRFYFDECADEDVAHALQALGLDVATASELGRKGLSDPEQLDYARQEGRVIYTTDDDFLRLAADCLSRSEFFPGVIYHAVGTRSKRQVIDALVLCDGVFEPADMHDHIEFI